MVALVELAPPPLPPLPLLKVCARALLRYALERFSAEGGLLDRFEVAEVDVKADAVWGDDVLLLLLLMVVVFGKP